MANYDRHSGGNKGKEKGTRFFIPFALTEDLTHDLVANCLKISSADQSCYFFCLQDLACPKRSFNLNQQHQGRRARL